MSEFGELIFHDGGVEQLVKDGVFHYPYPEKFPWVVLSQNVHAACQPIESDRRTYDQKAIPLIMDAVMVFRADQAGKKLLERQSFLVLEGTVADTVRIVLNDKGGLTIYTPEEE